MLKMTTRARMLMSTAGVLASFAAISALSSSSPAAAQTAAAPAPGVADPGVRGGAAGAGGTFAAVAADAKFGAYFTAAQDVFTEVDSVSGTIAGEDGVGLGPRFNSNGCASCHVFPVVGGSSPPGNFTTTDAAGHTVTGNPQVAVAKLDGATNTIPSFITATGPVREARFKFTATGAADGGVKALFTITGRTDAKPPVQTTTCTIAQPNFAQALAQNNVIFRIPTPVFGLGLVETTPDANLQATVTALAGQRGPLGISGNFNTSGNDGTITRFGWKAQNKSLLIFAGEAYNVEQGVTNEAFPNERDDTPGCQFNATPEDHTNVAVTASDAATFSSDAVNFSGFMRLLAPPTPVAATASTTRGSQVFQSVGCSACHAVSQTTTKSTIDTNLAANANGIKVTALSNVAYQPFSDFELHNMGLGLGDFISQGASNGGQFRSAPLWGAGKRVFFLHDGRTNNIVTAIEAHSSQGSEANAVVGNFNLLSGTDQQNLVNFLRSL